MTTVLQVVGGSESSPSLIYTRSQTAEVAAGGWGWEVGGGPAHPRMSHTPFTLSAIKSQGCCSTTKCTKMFKKKKKTNPKSIIRDSLKLQQLTFLRGKLPLQIPTAEQSWCLQRLTYDTAQGQNGGGWVMKR